VTAQPLLGSLAADPSLRGLFDTIKLFIEGANRGSRRATVARSRSCGREDPRSLKVDRSCLQLSDWLLPKLEAR